MAKTTMTTVKAFIRKNADNIYVKVNSSFSGMTDCVEDVEDEFSLVSSDKALGHQGVYVVGNSRDYIREYNDGKFKGFKISNCCGSGILATKIN
jgi:hypothetical protein